MVKPSVRKEIAQKVADSRNVTIKLACLASNISQTCYCYHATLRLENEAIADWLIKLTYDETDWGLGLCFDYVRNVKGFKWYHKRMCNVYCELALNLRIRPCRRINKRKPEPLKQSLRENQVWSIDFMHDQLSDGRKHRLF